MGNHFLIVLFSVCALVIYNCDSKDHEQKSSEEPKETTSNSDPDKQYFGQERPTTTPLLFAPGFISKPDRYEFGCTMTKDGTEFYFGVDNAGTTEIYQTLLVDGKWTDPVKLFQGDEYGNNDPMLSNDENRLYFISNRPNSNSKNEGDIDIWYAERRGKNWSEPINTGTPINSHVDEYFISFTLDETMYFSSKDKSEDAPRHAFDIYRSELNNGKYQTPERLPEQINTDRYEADVFIAPDESYMIFCSIRRNGMGSGDLYFSYKNDDNQWTEAVNMGDIVNSENHELCPFVSPDGKYFFYTSDKDIYWVSTDIFETYKKS